MCLYISRDKSSADSKIDLDSVMCRPNCNAKLKIILNILKEYHEPKELLRKKKLTLLYNSLSVSIRFDNSSGSGTLFSSANLRPDMIIVSISLLISLKVW